MILDKYKLQYEKPRIRKKRVYNTKAINKGNQSHKTWLMSLHKLSILIGIALLVAVSVALYQLRDYKIDTIGHVEAQVEAPQQTETIETTETPPEVKQEPVEAVNDPQGCEPEQYWDKNPPHNCIDKPKPVVKPKAKAPTVSLSKQELMKAVGIPESEWWAVDEIISRESGWNHLIWNRQGSGAYGLCQSLPASKMSSAGADYMTNPVTQLRWCHQYAQGYGGWIKAVQFSRCVGYCYSNRASKTVYKDHQWW